MDQSHNRLRGRVFLKSASDVIQDGTRNDVVFVGIFSSIVVPSPV